MMLKCEGLGRSFDGVVAVENVTFSMTAGESLALIGPNGAGKSTTLSMLTTMLRPDRGRADILGIDIAKDPRAVRGKLGVMFQDFALDESLTPRQTLRLHAVLHGIAKNEISASVDEALRWSNLTDEADRIIRGFSAGMRRRIELARALMHGPSLLVMDEPTAGLDPPGRRDLWARINDLRSTGLTVLLATHVLEEAERCDRIGIIDRGTLIALDTSDALRQRYGLLPQSTLEEVFVRATGHGLKPQDEAAQPGSHRRKVARR